MYHFIHLGRKATIIKVRPMIKINSPIWLAFLAFFFVAPLGTYFNMLLSERLE
jgi:hypothetical protein